MKFADREWADCGTVWAGDWALEGLDSVGSGGTLCGAVGGDWSLDIVAIEDVVNG